MRSGAGILLAWPLVAGLVVFWRVRKGDHWPQVISAVALATYTLWICSVAFFPLPLAAEAAHNRALRGGESLVNLVPFREMFRTMSRLDGWPFVRQFGGNILLLAPLTLLGPFLWPRLRTWWWPLAVGLGGSLAIEMIQLGISAIVGYPYRQADIDDVILNTVSAFLGYAGFMLGRQRKAAFGMI
jgi:glycopeptide antibiotics resistance protein